jgi:hypothetical protein
MLRKSIFWGLTLMLGTVLVWLVLKSRKEAQAPAGPVEIVRTAKSSSTRVIGPKDLDATESSVEVIPYLDESAKTAGRSAHAHVVIRNRGTVAYQDAMMKLTCFGGNGKVLGTQTKLVPGSIPPGESLTVDDVIVNNLPNGTARCRIGILYADLGPASSR